MAVDIVVGIAVLAAALKADRLRREDEARRREEDRRCRELALREKHVEERRVKALDDLLDEVSALDRLRQLIADLRAERASDATGRVASLLAFADARLARREAGMSAGGLERRLEASKLFGEDDDHDFRLPYYY